ncbi:hypothetical protein LQ938_04380 [Microbacterium sp. cx-55]|uniref:hypothetical protein n=1 Tax=Microbacterium sp. cx-55 TaxID=2875948 RepID=UPI001CC079FA|nr:hypothetical protein [Microbacterium sp. cx-55]MBZ4488724.1 hypothetical protein [Microbacterium sp. cx-55]UGB36038.1 hypothetical protein LQ938_04380 [Microbacterium sp. cx-55]
MRWDRFFEDLQDQFDAEWEAERAVLDTEAERLRLSRVALRERLTELGRGADADAPTLAWDLLGDLSITARVSVVGADWVGVETAGDRSGVIPLASIAAIGLGHADLLRSARPRASERASLTERMTLGFVLRDLVRRRTPVTVTTTGGRALAGTIDRAGADHLDLALHDPGSPRRADAVNGHRLVPFSAVSWVRVDNLERL